MRSSRKSSHFSRRRRDERERGTRPTEEPARSCSDNCRRRSGARALQHRDQPHAETTWPSRLGDSLAKGCMGSSRATGSARTGGVRDRSLPRLPVAANSALSARNDRADTFDDLPGLTGPQRAGRHHPRHLQHSPRPAIVFRRIRSARLGHQACRTRKSAGRFSLPVDNARTALRISARARIATHVSPTSSARVDPAHSVKAAQDHRGPAPRRGPRKTSLIESRSLTVISADSSCAVAGARPFACPRPRRKRHIAPGERTTLVVEDAQPRDSSPGTPVEYQQRLMSFAVDPTIAPLLQRRHQGRQVPPHRRELVLVAQIRDFYNQVGKLYLDFGFKPQDTKVLIETPDQVFAEYMTHARAAGTGRVIHHLFAGRLVEISEE